MLVGIGKLLHRNHVSVVIFLTKHRQKSSSLITSKVLPNSLRKVLQYLFHRVHLQQKETVTFLLTSLPPSRLHSPFPTFPGDNKPLGLYSDAVMYQSCENNMYGDCLVWFIFNLGGFTCLSCHLLFHHQHICMLSICMALGAHNFNLNEHHPNILRMLRGGKGWHQMI